VVKSSKIEESKFQNTKSKQIPMKENTGHLRFGISDLFGIWDLVLGISD